MFNAGRKSRLGEFVEILQHVLESQPHVTSEMEKRELTEEDIKAIQEAIRLAEEDMDDWREMSRVDPEMMRIPLGPAPLTKFRRSRQERRY